jgi:MFS family permease
VDVPDHPFVPLRRRSVRLVWGAGLFSDVGTWVQLIVVGSLVAQSSGSALQTGLIALATFMPQGICAPIGGLLADRHDRRHVFIAGLLGQAAATTLLTVLLALGVQSAFVLAGVILLSSGAGALGGPAFAAMLPDLVPPEELMAMVSLTIYSWNGGRIIGPLLGTVLVRTVGPSWTIAFNALTFAAMAASVYAVRRPFAPPGSAGTTIRERLAEGWHAVQRVAGCRYGIVTIMMLNLTIGPFMGLIPVFASEVFGGGTGMAGAFSALQGVGAILGSLAFTALAAQFGRARMMLVTAVVLSTSFVIYALAPVAAVAGIAVIGLGAGSSSTFLSGMSIIQRDAPAAERGRVLSISQASMGICYGIGIVWLGLIGDLLNLRVAFLISVAALVSSVVILTHRAPGWRAVIDGEVVVPATVHDSAVAP